MPSLKPLKREVGDRYRQWLTHRRIPGIPSEAVVSLEATEDVLFMCSRFADRFDPQPYLRELAFAHELAAHEREFAVIDDASRVFNKRVGWIVPGPFVSPRLWDYSRQVYDFAAGLERQGNVLFCSAAETLYWENKAYMHRRFEEVGVPTPATRLLTAGTWREIEFDFEPLLLKDEHSAGSSGIRFFPTATAAAAFVQNYPFRPNETLIMQEVVAGAVRDMRVTMVGSTMIPEASYWRTKRDPSGNGRANWTTTATTFNSRVTHAGIPDSVAPFAAQCLRQLELRTAGIDLIWVDDDVSRTPLVLELSPYYQPNPPKPERYTGWTYKQYKERPYVRDGYIDRQYRTFRTIIRQAIRQGFF
jgi:glutathione synthase/RimK-type ligase-like ATP-grasp enzyme